MGGTGQDEFRANGDRSEKPIFLTPELESQSRVFYEAKLQIELESPVLGAALELRVHLLKLILDLQLVQALGQGDLVQPDVEVDLRGLLLVDRPDLVFQWSPRLKLLLHL